MKGKNNYKGDLGKIMGVCRALAPTNPYLNKKPANMLDEVLVVMDPKNWTHPIEGGRLAERGPG